MGTLIILSTVLLAILVYVKKSRRVRPPYPPGPSRLPVLGNLLSFPTSFEWITYDKWCKEIGSDVIYIQVCGKSILVLNSMEAIDDLLEKKSAIYSSRPRFPMTIEMMRCDWVFTLLPYGKAWKDRRQLFARYFRPSSLETFLPGQKKFVQSMLPGLLHTPDNFLSVLRYTVAGSALSLAYGLPLKKKDDPNIELAEEMANKIGISALPSNFIVNLIPALKYIPDFMPGAGFKQKAREWKVLSEKLRSKPFEELVARMKSGNVIPSFTSLSLQGLDETSPSYSDDRKMIMDVAATIFLAGADTTLSVIITFFAAMMCFPDVQKKAQHELDRVLPGRLPDFKDERDLPYITALIKEVTRWGPITPIGGPHTSSEDDIYRGYYIPKGTTVIANSWSLLQDEEHYPEPTEFRPERFLKNGQLNKDIRDPTKIIFGYGRRICPGSDIALSFIFLTVATILSTFDISKELDIDGNVVEPKLEWHPGVVCELKPFRCTIKPRSKEAEELIRSVDFEEIDV